MTGEMLVNKRPKVTVAALKSKKRRGQRITMLTAYDSPMASFIDKAGVDIVLVSDAVGTVGNGRPEAVSVTVDEMIYHTRAVRNGVTSSMVVTTLPFGAYADVNGGVANAFRVLKEGGADAVHIEGTGSDATLVRAIVDAGIPVMGHIGIIKQKIVRSGYFQLPGRDVESAKELVDDAVAMVKAGVFALVLECLPMRLGQIISQAIEIPTIGIGSGVYCDGQALVTQDMLGLYQQLSPRFLKVYADMSQTITRVLEQYRQEVETGVFPSTEHSYSMDDGEFDKLLERLEASSG